MILVTVGLHSQPFDRLIRKMDELCPLLDQEVIMQIGHAKYIPQKASYFRFATGEDMNNLMERADLVITHGGVGTLLEVFRSGKAVVAVPRLKRYGEHIDDHQLEFLQAMERQGLLRPAYDMAKLFDAIGEAERNPAGIRKGRLEAAVKRYVHLLMS